MANATYVAQLQELKTKITETYQQRVTWTTTTLKAQYDEQIAFIDKLIAKYSQ